MSAAANPPAPSYRFTIIFTIGLLLVIGLVVGAALWLSAPERQLTERFEGPASFSLRYPAGWMAVIPEQGIMVVAAADTLGGQPGPALTISRSTMLMNQGDLPATLEYYLAHGPEVTNRQWTRLTDITPVAFDGGREAVAIDLQGREFEGDPELRIRLLVTRADSLAVYVFGASAPAEDWGTDGPLLQAILDSVHIVE